MRTKTRRRFVDLAVLAHSYSHPAPKKCASRLIIFGKSPTPAVHAGVARSSLSLEAGTCGVRIARFKVNSEVLNVIASYSWMEHCKKLATNGERKSVSDRQRDRAPRGVSLLIFPLASLSLRKKARKDLGRCARLLNHSRPDRRCAAFRHSTDRQRAVLLYSLITKHAEEEDGENKREQETKPRSQRELVSGRRGERTVPGLLRASRRYQGRRSCEPEKPNSRRSIATCTGSAPLRPLTWLPASRSTLSSSDAPPVSWPVSGSLAASSVASVTASSSPRPRAPLFAFAVC